MYRSLLFAVLTGVAGVSVLPSPAFAEESCPASGPVMSRDAMTKSLHERGYIQIRSLETHNGCYEAKGLDAKGHRFELELNGGNGDIVNAE